MTEEEAHTFIMALYQHLLRRQPQSEELLYWTNQAQASQRSEEIVYLFLKSPEYIEKSRVHTLFAPGHYYSPVVDPDGVREYVSKEQASGIKEIYAIDIAISEMESWWNRQAHVIKSTPFTEEKDDIHRFYYNNNIFPYGDAIALRAMIAELEPKRIIEIGSGFSSACMLDTFDEFKLETELVCIDPFTERLESIMRSSDRTRVEIIRKELQVVSTDLFSRLEPGDILFIDSTHVLKTGSDVHFELFHILPILNPGVIVHFHDIHFPFEYPDAWTFDLNHSWNEIYALRAFLMYNEAFKVRFWGSCFVRERYALVRETSSTFLKNPGGSIWIQKTR